MKTKNVLRTTYSVCGSVTQQGGGMTDKNVILHTYIAGPHSFKNYHRSVLSTHGGGNILYKIT